MYLDGSDYRTVWQLAHDWAGKDSESSNPESLSPEIKESIHRIIIAIKNKLISARSNTRVILGDDDFVSTVLDFHYLVKLNACAQKDRFDKKLLNSLYVWRPEVIRWCQNDLLPIPPVWRTKLEIEFAGDSDADDEHWYKRLTPRKKSIVAALHIAERIWQSDKTLLYEDVLNHEDMKKYNKPQIFPSLESFKEWARDIAPVEAKKPGKRKISA